MLIGIDGNEANESQRVGVHQYAYEILWGLYKLQDSNTKYRIYLKNTPKEDLPPKKEGWEYKVLPSGGFWIIRKLMPELFKGKKCDVFFGPSHYLPFFAPIPMVCSITDLGYLNFSGQFKKKDLWQLKLWTAKSISISKYIISISKSTAKDIVRHYKKAHDKVHVIYLGYDTRKFNSKISDEVVRRTLKKYRISKNYLVFISTLKPSKNVEGLLEAYAKIFPCDHQLVIVGKKGWFYESIFEKVKSLGLENHVIFTDYIPEKDKGPLLTGAKAFLLPSFWEGFGMDVLSALACGTPVVVSDVGSLPEVAGDAGIYVDPYNIESISKGIRKVLEMTPTEYRKVVNKGLKQAKRFSWEKCAKETLEILRSAA